MKVLYPDYDNCIANLACSILKHFGVEPPNNTLPLADKYLEKRYKNTVVLLLDGMGKNIIEANLQPHGFFRRNLKGIYSSTFPPTTVAATTSLDSGLYPNQTAWLGWEGYFKEIDKNVVYFLNTDQQKNIAADFNVAWTYCPYLTVTDRINSAGKKAFYVTPFVEPYPKTFDDLCNVITRLCNEDGEKYIYAYCEEPDHTMHGKGCFGEAAKKVIKEVEERAELLAEELSDTLLIITADHGHIDSKNESISEYPDIVECLVRMPSIEPRALNLFVKEGMSKQLEEAFKKHFKDKFMLIPKAEVLKTQLFGKGENHSRIEDMLGDFVAVAVDDLSIFNSIEEKDKFIGVHAGLTEDEMLIPLIAVEKP